jgi:acyl-CoA thioester hydrolase
MARIDIKLPGVFTFVTRVPVRIGDINRGQHVGHLAILGIIEEARARFWTRCGQPEQDRTQADFGFIIADLAIVYLRQVSYSPDLRIEVATGDFSAKGYAIYYRVSECATGLEIARAKTGIVVFDYRRQKALEVPEDLKERLTSDYLT